MKMFWGVTLEKEKRYTQIVEASFHLSMAALDPNPPATVDVSKNPTVSVWLQHDKAEFLLCTLEYGKIYQQTLDSVFTEGEEVTFFVNGKGVIHLTGYLIDDMSMAEESMMEPMMSSSEDDDEDSDESEDIPVLVDAQQLAIGAKKRSKDMQTGNWKKIKMDGEEEESNSDFSETGDEDEDEEDEDEEEDDSSEEDSTEDSDESGGDHDNTSDKKAIKAKPENVKKTNSNSLPQIQTKGAKETKLFTKLKNKEKKNIANSGAGEESAEQAALDAALLPEKKKKKKRNKNKNTKTAETSNNAAAAANIKPEVGTPSEDPKSNARTMASGLVVEDTYVGQGAEARIGRQVHVYYNGKLAKSGKQFDKCMNGKPFRFTLGKKEVIQGWDKGLIGMRVGGKRKLTVPAKLGYGSQSNGPIPPNSSLVFDIELKALS